MRNTAISHTNLFIIIVRQVRRPEKIKFFYNVLNFKNYIL